MEVAPLGEGCEPLRMVLVGETLVEFEEVEAWPKDAVESGTAREEGAGLGLIPREEMPLEDWSSSYLAAFSNWLGMPAVGFEAKILAFLCKMKARKEVRV